MLDSSGAHPVLACVQRVGEELAGIADVPVEYLGTSEKADALVALTATTAQLEALRLRLLAASDDVAARDGARDPGAWLAHETRGDRREQQRDHRLATALADRWHQVATGLGDGAVNLAQARVITHALDALPADVDADVITRAEAQLVGYAADFAPAELRVLGRRILDVVAPEVAEAAEARALEAEERHAAEHTTLTLTPCGDGTTRTNSEILDLGRTSRLYNRAQRKALRIRDRRCRARGCTVPATWCEAHHLTPWALGGNTDLQDGVLLCSFHHHRAHDPTYETTRHLDGDLAIRRRRERAA